MNHKLALVNNQSRAELNRELAKTAVKAYRLKQSQERLIRMPDPTLLTEQERRQGVSMNASYARLLAGERRKRWFEFWR